jgi:hypothetical protein
LNDRSPLRRFITVSRNFGIVIAMRVAYSKVRGRLWPALALPDAPVYNANRRVVSVMLSTADHGAATLNAVAEVLSGRGGLDWEVCICERSPAEPGMARTLARLRGARPEIRIVTTDESVDDALAARWTVEQATGEFVALLAPGYALEASAISMLLARLLEDSGIDAAVLVGANGGSGSLRSSITWTNYQLLLQRKSKYLATQTAHWLLTAPALVKYLYESGVPIRYISIS